MTETAPMRVGIIGCGNIAAAYQGGCKHYPGIELIHVADLDVDRAKERGKEWGVPTASDVDGLLNNPDVELVVNLTIPAAHAEVDRLALEAGKHVHSEKPLALSCAEARPVLELAAERGLRLGCAPDTFLGSGHQLARKCVDDGHIGTPTSATLFMQGRGHEHWHPSPAFYYQAGGGPMLDMGPYYLTAIVNLLGPVVQVAGFTGKAFETRTITSKPMHGQTMDVEIDTHIAATLRFASGAIATMIMSFDIAGHTLPPIQLHGTKGSLDIPDPNGFGGDVRLKAWGNDDWETVTPLEMETGRRGAGPADIAASLKTGQPHRASGDLAFHVLDVMECITRSSQDSAVITVASSCERPAPLEAASVAAP
ncbi:MAG: Gfo/Idh/MocA family oxidoreductase [Planctomycetota bacterium]